MDSVFVTLVTRVMTVVYSHVLMTAMTKATVWMASVSALRAFLETPVACKTVQMTAKRMGAALMDSVYATRAFLETTALWVRFLQDIPTGGDFRYLIILT